MFPYSLFNPSVFAAMPQSYNNPMQMLSALRNDPAGILRARGLNIPDGMNDPSAIINHLLNSGQVNNQRLQMAQQMAQQFRR